VNAWILGSGGWMPTDRRETTSVLVRWGDDALLLDAGTGARRLVTDPALVDGVARLDVVLTHFHLDHVCGLAYLPAIRIASTVWAPGRWLYGRSSAELLAPLRDSPISPFSPAELGEIVELEPGRQQIGRFTVAARAQLRHWAPTAGLRVGDALALVTDTGYDPEGIPFAHGVGELLHEAWSAAAAPRAPEHDATGRDAALVAAGAAAQRLTLIHLNPLIADHTAILADARAIRADAELGRDRQALRL
jgi:ribonuclease BN (tRNA processing enzyme)